MNCMVKEHSKDVSEFKKEASRAKDPDVQASPSKPCRSSKNPCNWPSRLLPKSGAKQGTPRNRGAKANRRSALGRKKDSPSATLP